MNKIHANCFRCCRSVESEEASETYIVEDDDDMHGRLTPWEQWVLRKAKEDQEKVQKKIDRKKKEREERDKKEQVSKEFILFKFKIWIVYL